MTDFERRLRTELHREAARLVPDDTARPGLPATSDHSTAASNWFARWRVPLLAAAAVVVVAAAVSAIVLNNRDTGMTMAGPGGSGPDGSQSSVAPPQFSFPMMSRVKDYRSLQELAGDSTNVVLATPTGASHDEPLPTGAANPNVESSAPNTFVTLTVSSVLTGEDITADDQIEVTSFGEDTDGRPALTVPGQYLLFLAPSTLDAAPGEPFFGVEHYVVVGVAAGLYYQLPASTNDSYDKSDLDSPDLPDDVAVDSLDLMAGWYDAAYMDHALAGEVPELLPPLQHPAGSVDSTVFDSPTEPFLCDGAETSAAAELDEGWMLFGITDTMFCVSMGDPASDDRVTGQVQLTGEGPIRGMVRIGTGWESQAVGVVDGSVTTVLAIRGDDDATHPNDPIPDWEIGLNQVGDLRAFVTDDSTGAVVAYIDGVEVARESLPVNRTDDATGGHGGDLEFYDLRDDLTDLHATNWTTWAQLDPSTVRIFFTAGSSACYGAAVTVDETPDQVAIGLQTGWKPEIDGCEAIAVAAAVDITLTDPLGSRTVIPQDIG